MKVSEKTVLEHCQLKNGLAAGEKRSTVGHYGHTSLAASRQYTQIRKRQIYLIFACFGLHMK